MKIGMSTACFYGEGLLEENVVKIGKMGCVRTLEVFLNTASEYEQKYVRMLKQRIDDYGMTVY